MTAADDRIRAAHAALVERDHVMHLRTALVVDLVAADQAVATLAATLAEEQRDVSRYQRGVWAFLYDLFADREARLSTEQQEALQAEARHAEAVTARNRLAEEVASLDARIVALQGAEGELVAARAEKQSLLVAGGGPTADELASITQQLGQSDAEARAIDEALAAGERARAAMSQLAQTLGSARNWGAADMLTDSFFVSWAKRNKLDEARGLAGSAQAELVVFQRELGDLGLALHAEVAGLSNHHRFLDTWFDNIFSDLAVQSRIKEAQATTDQTLAAVDHRVHELRVRRQTLAQRSQELGEEWLRRIEPA